ncbi:MAG TPA: hypothetical protein VNO26_03600 [Candidatus Limnocylindria bacterium]|nr:hypothetical protein [Candidatus Limnocylindria bacterium]
MSGPRMVAAAVALGCAFAAEPVLADDVMLQVVTVKARERGETDPELRRLRPRLRNLVGYRSYRMVNEQRRGCSWHTPQQFVLPGGRVLLLRPERLADQHVVMQVRLLQADEELIDTDVQLRNQGVMFLAMGRNGRAHDGALLIMLKAGVPK